MRTLIESAEARHLEALSDHLEKPGEIIKNVIAFKEVIPPLIRKVTGPSSYFKTWNPDVARIFFCRE